MVSTTLFLSIHPNRDLRGLLTSGLHGSSCKFITCLLLPRLLARLVVSSFFRVINNPVIDFLVHKSWSVPLIISVGSIPRSRILGAGGTDICRAPDGFGEAVCRKSVPSLACVRQPRWHAGAGSAVGGSDLPPFGGQGQHAWFSSACPRWLEKAELPFGGPASPVGAVTTPRSCGTRTRLVPGTANTGEGSCQRGVPSRGPEHMGKPGWRAGESQLGATQPGPRGLWAARRVRAQARTGLPGEMLAIASYLGDLGPVTDLEEAGSCVCTAAEGHREAAEMRLISGGGWAPAW